MRFVIMEQGVDNNPAPNAAELDWLEFWPEDREFTLDQHAEVLLSGQLHDGNTTLKSEATGLQMHGVPAHSGSSTGILEDLGALRPGLASDAFQVRLKHVATRPACL